MMERPTTIRADQWELVAEDVAAGRCEVWDFDDDIVIKITPRNYGFNVFNINSNGDSWISDSYSTFTVRWLDTAQTERDKAAFAEFEAGYQAAAGDAPSVNVFAAYVGELEAMVASLQAERDQLTSKLAAVGAENERLRTIAHAAEIYCAAAPFAHAQYQPLKDAVIQWQQGEQSTPQPAPAPAGNSELVAAVEMREQLTHLQSVVLDSATKTGDKDHILELIDNLFGLIDNQ